MTKQEHEIEHQRKKVKDWEAKLLELQTNLNTKATNLAELEQNIKKSEKMTNMRKVQLYQNLDKFNNKLEDFSKEKVTLEKRRVDLAKFYK